jgi:hypothetical protein
VLDGCSGAVDGSVVGWTDWDADPADSGHSREQLDSRDLVGPGDSTKIRLLIRGL